MNPNYCQCEIHTEIHMYTKTVFIVACALFAGSVAAGDDEFTVAYRVSTQSLDLSLPAGARELYTRLKRAAEVVCTHGMRVDLAPTPDPQGCYEKALADAIRFAHMPLVTQAYLATHTLEQASVRGTDVPVQVAAK
jgi:UrcA family protein